MTDFEQINVSDFIGNTLFVTCFIINIACKKGSWFTDCYESSDTVYIFAEFDFSFSVLAVEKLNIKVTENGFYFIKLLNKLNIILFNYL